MNLRRGVTAACVGALAALGSGIAVADHREEQRRSTLTPDADRNGKTDIKRYLRPVPRSGFQTEALLSAGDLVQETGAPQGTRYQFVGIPDGLGATKEDLQGRRNFSGDDDRRRGNNKDTKVFVNHELTQATTSNPRLGRARQRGAFVDEYRLDDDGRVLTGRRAFDQEFQDDTRVDSADSPARAFSRFCSAFLADSDEGFDRPIFLTGEETSGRVQENGNFEADSFDRSRGSQTVAVFTNDDGRREAHALSDFGFFAKENTVVVPGTGKKTVAFSTEDGPQTPDSQLYMYVGEKQKRGTVLQRNGLVGGKLFVFVPRNPAINSEAQFNNGTLDGRFVEIPREQRENEIELEAAADARNAFGFVRIEDGAVGRTKNEFQFVTTGDSSDQTINRVGANYRLEFKRRRDPERQRPRLSVIYNADQVAAAQQDIAFAPDNMDVIGKLQAIQEDGTASARPEYEKRDRDGSVWLVDGGGTSQRPGDFPRRKRVAFLVGRPSARDQNPPAQAGARDGVPTTAGVWESSGIIDVAKEFDRGRGDGFLLDVQAHKPTNAPCPGGATFGAQCVPETVEDGQLLFLREGNRDDD